MNVLSLFDGISGARVALDRLHIPVTYYASEIDKYAIQIAQKNYPDTIQLGDVQSINPYLLPKIDLLVGGSPCSDLSGAGKQAGINGERSRLFFDYIRLLRYLKPKYFLLENVASMKKLDKYIITQFMGVEAIKIDSALVSAQQRKRLYWTNIKGVTQPEDRKIYLKDILEDGVVDRDKSYCIDANYWKKVTLPDYYRKHRRQVVLYRLGHGYVSEEIKEHDKYPSLAAQSPSSKYLLVEKDSFRMLTPTECERLQTFDDNYTEGISKTQRYKALGNSFTVEVISHILSFMEL